MLITRRSALLGGLSLAVASAAPFAATADPAATARKINVAGRQRMLSQRIAMAASMARLGVDAGENLEVLRIATTQFDAAQRALRSGSEDFGLPEETHPSVLSALSRSDVTWAEMSIAADAITSQGSVARQNFEDIAELNLKLLSRANIVVKKLVSAYSEDDRGGSGFGRAIDMAGRQRMLSQKMIKETALIGLNYRKSDNRDFLEETLTLFDDSLFKLMYGDEGEGIPEPPTEVFAKYQQVEALWLDLYPLMDETATLGRADDFELSELSVSAFDLLRLSNEAVGLYERAWSS
ncbi:MAG: type IV pili methyl-accepting chemotaxis transducer N-terminal domain-containing protein [Pseudomonadota bacterium]